MNRLADEIMEKSFLEHFLGLHGPRTIRQPKKVL